MKIDAIANNFIHVGGQGTAYGIFLDGSLFHRIYHNSVHITSTAPTAGRALFFTSGFNDIKNNVIVNSGGGYAVYAQSVSPSSGVVSDYNNFYSTGPHLAYWSGQRSELSAWQSYTGLDAHSFEIDPGFVSATDLHLEHPLLNQAAPALAGVSSDIDGQIRNVVMADVGADEFGFGGRDIALIDVQAPADFFPEGPQDVSVVVANQAAEPLSGFSIEWAVNDSVQASFAFTDTLLPEQIDTLEIGRYRFRAGTSYTIRAWSSPASDLSPANNEVVRDSIYPALGGTYTLGPSSADFATLRDVAEALNQGGVYDTVIINVQPGSYPNTRVTFGAIPQAAAERPIILQSATRQAESVIFSNHTNASVLHLQGTQHLKVRHVSISGAFSYIVHLSKGASHNTFAHNRITNANDRAVLVMLDDRFYSGVATFSSHNVFDHNQLIGGEKGIEAQATQAFPSADLAITHNVFENQKSWGLYLYAQQAPLIRGNQFTRSEKNPRYVHLHQCAGSTTIAQNQFRRGTRFAISMEGCEATAKQPARIVNNLFHQENQAPIFQAGASSGIQLLHNTFYLEALSPAYSSPNPQAPVLDLSRGDAFSFVNNIFYANVISKPLFSLTPGAIQHSDYNVFYAPQEASFLIDDQPIAGLAAWQATTGFDAHSLRVAPQVQHPDSMMPTASRINGAGTFLPHVPMDAFGRPRNPQAPDIGAVEFVVPERDAELLELHAPQAVFAPGAQAVRVALRNNGSIPIAAVRLRWRVNEQEQDDVFWQGTLPPGDTLRLPLGTWDFRLFHPYEVGVEVASVNQQTDAFAHNNQLLSDTLYAGMAGTYTVGAVGADFASISDAIRAAKRGGMLGPVTFLLQDGVFDEQVIIPAIAGASDANWLSIQSESRDSTAVVWQYSSMQPMDYILKLEGASYLDLSYIHFRRIQNTGDRLIELGDRVEHCRIHHNLLDGNQHPERLIGIQKLGGLNYARNIEIRQNHFRTMFRSISWQQSGNGSGQLSVIQNTMEDFHGDAIYLERTSSVEIRQNLIQTDTARNSAGINLRYCEGSLHIAQNRILVPAYRSGIEINDYQATPSRPGQLVNNLIAASNFGMRISLGVNLRIFHNSIRVDAPQSGNPYQISAAALEIGGGEVQLYNNLFANMGGGYVLNLQSGSPFVRSNYNNLYTEGEFAVYRGQVSGPGAATLSLADWQFFSGQDRHSLVVDPDFTSPVDLSSHSPRLDSAGIPLETVRVDVDGTARDAAYPDIGAIEFVIPFADLALEAILLDTLACGLGTETSINVELANVGNTLIRQVQLAFILNGASPVYATEEGLTLAPGELTSFTFPQGADLSRLGVHELQVYVVEAGGTAQRDRSNDTLSLRLLHHPGLEVPPLGLSPADGAIELARPIVFRWDSVPHSMGYDLYLWEEGSAVGSLAHFRHLRNLSYTYEGPLKPLQTYRWQVVAQGYCDSLASEVYAFTTSRMPITNDPRSQRVAPDPHDGTQRLAPAIKVFPNPTDGQLHLHLPPGQQEARVRLYTLAGQVVHYERMHSEGGQLLLSLLHLAEGTYLLEISLNKEKIRKWIQFAR